MNKAAMHYEYRRVVLTRLYSGLDLDIDNDLIITAPTPYREDGHYTLRYTYLFPKTDRFGIGFTDRYTKGKYGGLPLEQEQELNNEAGTEAGQYPNFL